VETNQKHLAQSSIRILHSLSIEATTAAEHNNLFFCCSRPSPSTTPPKQNKKSQPKLQTERHYLHIKHQSNNIYGGNESTLFTYKQQSFGIVTKQTAQITTIYTK